MLKPSNEIPATVIEKILKIVIEAAGQWLGYFRMDVKSI
jgi:hypothetical protein